MSDRKWMRASELERTGCIIDPAKVGDDRALVERLRQKPCLCQPINRVCVKCEAAAAIERLTCDLSRAREALGKYETVMHYARRWREVVDANNNHPKVRDLVSAIDGDALKGEA